jgi:hypothetical protein
VIVLIAAPEQLASLTQGGEFASAQTFSDTEALRALETITRQKPSVVALEQAFAASSRGTALVNRIKADPSLSGCQIRIVTNGATADGATTDADVAVVELVDVTPEEDAAPAEPDEAPLPQAPLDQRGTRRAPRHRMSDGVEVNIDGNPAALVDLSVVGAMVVSPTILRPNQRVRFTLSGASAPIRIRAAVAWATFEMPKGGPRYRAGIEFFGADADALAAFIEAKKQ